MAEYSDSTKALLQKRSLKIDIQHLRYAVAAADHGSFRQAAESLMVQQSSLSRCVHQLEQASGVIVFDRSSGGVRATQAGRYFLRMARSILEQLDALITHTQSTGRGEAGRLTVGFYTSLSAGNLRATLMDFKQRFPEIELGMTERSRAGLVSALRNGTLDIAIVTGDALLQDSKALSLWSERTLVALPEEHSLASREVVYWTDLQSERLLISGYDLGRELEDLVLSKLVSPENRPKIERYDVSRGIIKSLVSLGFGISIVMESDTGTRFSGLMYRELHDGAGSSRIGYSAHWCADNENPALASILNLLKERYPSP